MSFSKFVIQKLCSCKKAKYINLKRNKPKKRETECNDKMNNKLQYKGYQGDSPNKILTLCRT